MIGIDFSQLAIQNITGNYGSSGNLNENLIRHIVLNSIRDISIKNKNVYHDLILACDNSRYWRTEIFPHYKFKRKKMKEDSKFDWVLIYSCLDKIKEELKLYAPYKVIDVDGAEGDDVIAVLAKWSNENDFIQEGLFNSPKPFLIISRDYDFIQLHKYSHVKQYSPITRKFIKPNVSPSIDLKEKIIRGDTGDSIPNFLSPDNSFVDGIRQKSIMDAKMPEYLTTDFNDNTYYRRNQMLIDFDYIPKKVSTDIIDAYLNTKGKSKSVFMNYLIEYRLKNLISDIGDF
jgi:hypothetical protein